jgi:S1-C subfamily serine protease
MIGDILLRWQGEALGGLRDVMRRLGSESVGQRAELDLLRGGAPTKVTLTVGERPAG